MNRSKSSIWSLIMLLVALAFIMSTTRTLAVNDVGNFELDGNAAEEAANGDDWEKVFAGTGSNVPGQANRVDDAANVPDVTYYTGGKSKDIYDIPNWQYNANGTQDKAQITNAFATAYKGGLNNNDYLYFGADRYSNDGNTFIGFWFFQNEIGTSGGKFTGTHKDGDLLVLSDFTNGGAVSTIKVYKWINGALQTTGFSGSDCDSSAHTADPEGPCAKVNAGGETAYWNYTPKPNVGSPGSYPRGTFYEGGINLSQLFPQGVPCFTSYLAETRASQEPTATLSDFALGQLGSCGLSVTKTARTTNVCANANTSVIYDYVVTNTGSGTLNVNVSDDNGTPNTTSDDIDIDGGSGDTLAGGASKSYSRSFTINATTTNIVTATGTNGTFSTTATDTATVNANLCEIRGKKFQDMTANGPSADDTVLSGWTIQLWSNPEGASPVATTTTDANGEYAFLNLSPGSYIVKEVQQAGWNQTAPAAPGTHLVTIVATGTVSAGNDFHNAQLFKMIILTCNQLTNELVVSEVSLNGTTTTTLGAAPAGLTSQQLCGLGGATYQNLPKSTYNPSVKIPQ